MSFQMITSLLMQLPKLSVYNAFDISSSLVKIIKLILILQLILRWTEFIRFLGLADLEIILNEFIFIWWFSSINIIIFLILLIKIVKIAFSILKANIGILWRPKISGWIFAESPQIVTNLSRYLQQSSHFFNPNCHVRGAHWARGIFRELLEFIKVFRLNCWFFLQKCLYLLWKMAFL